MIIFRLFLFNLFCEFVISFWFIINQYFTRSLWSLLARWLWNGGGVHPTFGWKNKDQWLHRDSISNHWNIYIHFSFDHVEKYIQPFKFDSNLIWLVAAMMFSENSLNKNVNVSTSGLIAMLLLTVGVHPTKTEMLNDV